VLLQETGWCRLSGAFISMQLVVFSVCLQVYLISFTNLESTILPVYLGIVYWLIQSTPLAFIHFREVKEIDGMNRNNKGWEPE
jgi:hypothetical protein